MSAPLDATRYLEHRRRSGSAMPQLGSRVLLALHPAARPAGARQLGGPFGRVERKRFGSDVVTVSPLGPGPAVAAMTIEMLACLGVREVVAVGIASRVWREADEPELGTTHVVERAISNESVSSRYGGSDESDPDATLRLSECLDVGTVVSYSTSTPFRVDVAEVMASDAALVDMEASALFSSGSDSGVAVSLAVVTSDATTQRGWVGGDEADVGRRVGIVAALCRTMLVSAL